MQSPTTPSTVVAHNDSIWFTLPLYGKCPAVSSPSLLRSQAGAQFCDIWKAGLFLFAIDWHFHNFLRQPYLGSSITPVDLSQWRCYLFPLLYYAVSLDSSSPYGQLFSRMQAVLFRAHYISRRSIFTAPAGTRKQLRRRGGRGRSKIRIMCNIFFFLLFLGFSTPYSPLCVITM